MLSDFPVLRNVVIDIGYDCGAINREQSLERWLREAERVLFADGVPLEDLRLLESFLVSLNPNELDTVTLGESADADDICVDAPFSVTGNGERVTQLLTCVFEGEIRGERKLRSRVVPGVGRSDPRVREEMPVATGREQMLQSRAGTGGVLSGNLSADSPVAQGGSDRPVRTGQDGEGILRHGAQRIAGAIAWTAWGLFEAGVLILVWLIIAYDWCLSWFVDDRYWTRKTLESLRRGKK